MINYLLFCSAIILTSISGYISVIGLTSIFSSASSYYVILTIAVSLEISKVLSTIWLKVYWNKCSILLKGYLCSTVMVLVLSNSISSFGFLSKSHIEQQLNLSNLSDIEISLLNTKVENQKQVVQDFDKQITTIDDSIKKLIDSNRGQTALSAINNQKKNRDKLISDREAEKKILFQLISEQALKTTQYKKLQAELGPIKYFAQLFSITDTENAVRLLIILIISVFDPLAIILLIAANSGINASNEREIKKYQVHEIKI